MDTYHYHQKPKQNKRINLCTITSSEHFRMKKDKRTNAKNHLSGNKKHSWMTIWISQPLGFASTSPSSGK